MPRKTSRSSASPTKDWSKRLHSARFRKALRAAVRVEILSLADARFADVIDARKVRALLRQGRGGLVDQQAVADLAIHMSTYFTQQLARQKRSLAELLNEPLVERVEALLDGDASTSQPMEGFIAALIGEPFIQGLFTDIIYTSIVSFNKRVNPFFGRIAMAVMEDQIKGFISLFMPMVQKEAVAFATSRDNQAALFKFTRAILRRVLHEPLAHFVSTPKAEQKTRGDALIRQVIGDAGIEELSRKAVLAGWDTLYRRIRNRKVGELIHLDKHAGWLADHVVDAVLPVLTRPAILELIAIEAG